MTEESQKEILRRALNLSLAIYRVTEKLPRGEILVWQIRKLSNELIGRIVFGDWAGSEKRINLLSAYFKIARAQNWLKEGNWYVLETAYKNLKQEIIIKRLKGELLTSRKEPAFQEAVVDKPEKIYKSQSPLIRGQKIGSAARRQNKILEEMRKQGTIKISDLAPLFKKQVSERAVRNDLQVLIDKGLITKNGSNKTREYALK